MDSQDLSSNVIISKFDFVKNNVNYTDYAEDFLENERVYFDIIQSYTTEKLVGLTIRLNDTNCSIAQYSEDGLVKEYFRNDISYNEVKEFSSIWSWVNDYYGETVTAHCLLNSVYIGENNVPIWKILVDANEEDNDDEYGKDDKEDKYDDPLSPPILVLMFVLMLFVCGIITVISLITIG